MIKTDFHRAIQHYLTDYNHLHLIHAIQPNNHISNPIQIQSYRRVKLEKQNLIIKKWNKKQYHQLTPEQYIQLSSLLIILHQRKQHLLYCKSIIPHQYQSQLDKCQLAINEFIHRLMDMIFIKNKQHQQSITTASKGYSTTQDNHPKSQDINNHLFQNHKYRQSNKRLSSKNYTHQKTIPKNYSLFHSNNQQHLQQDYQRPNHHTYQTNKENQQPYQQPYQQPSHQEPANHHSLYNRRNSAKHQSTINQHHPRAYHNRQTKTLPSYRHNKFKALTQKITKNKKVLNMIEKVNRKNVKRNIANQHTIVQSEKNQQQNQQIEQQPDNHSINTTQKQLSINSNQQQQELSPQDIMLMQQKLLANKNTNKRRGGVFKHWKVERKSSIKRRQSQKLETFEKYHNQKQQNKQMIKKRSSKFIMFRSSGYNEELQNDKKQVNRLLWRKKEDGQEIQIIERLTTKKLITKKEIASEEIVDDYKYNQSEQKVSNPYRVKLSEAFNLSKQFSKKIKTQPNQLSNKEKLDEEIEEGQKKVNPKNIIYDASQEYLNDQNHFRKYKSSNNDILGVMNKFRMYFNSLGQKSLDDQLIL